jgi:hypothetical protein
MDTRIIENCSVCPFLYRNSEFPQTICQLIDQEWWPGYYTGGPSPNWCPLLEKSVKIKHQNYKK